MPDRPDPVTDRLVRFTPNAAGLHRDALLFAAGQRSARGSRLWPAAVAVLGVSQVVTLALLWPNSPEPPATAPVAPAVAPAPELSAPPTSSPRDVWTAGSSPDVLAAPSGARPGEMFVTSEPPLTAGFGRRFD
jgi:hypothetical protein